MFSRLEKPVAYAAFVYACLALLWKSPLGLDWIPVLGPAWDAIFQTQGSKEFAQYPRRTEDEEFWHMVYLVMYGVLGTVAQFCGLMISRQTISRVALVMYSKIYALFHLTIGVHHLCWSFNRSHGKLQLWRFQLPGLYMGTAFSAVVLIYHALCIGRGTVRKANLKDICYRKSVMDTATCCIFISFLIFLIANMIGMETSFRADQVWWGITMYVVPIVLVLGFVLKDD